jgi:hypothetical protein
MPGSNDTRTQTNYAGEPLHPREAWSEGSEADGSAGAEYTVPAGALYCVFFSSVAAFCAATTEALLDIAGAGFNGMGMAAGGHSQPIPVVGKSKVAIKAVSGNLAVVTVTWYGSST